jgi:hypothetical protein
VLLGCRGRRDNRREGATSLRTPLVSELRCRSRGVRTRQLADDAVAFVAHELLDFLVVKNHLRVGTNLHAAVGAHQHVDPALPGQVLGHLILMNEKHFRPPGSGIFLLLTALSVTDSERAPRPPSRESSSCG